jgi:hypothetical protein
MKTSSAHFDPYCRLSRAYWSFLSRVAQKSLGLLGVATLFVCSTQGLFAVIIQSGYDFMTTASGQTSVDVFGQTLHLQGLNWAAGNAADSLWGKPNQGHEGITFVTIWLDPHGNIVNLPSQHKVTQITVPTVSEVFDDFDTVIHRPNAVNIAGVAAQVSTAVEFEWLSLEAANNHAGGTTIPGYVGSFDIYVGLNRNGSQPKVGNALLTSGTASGDAGTISLGSVGDPVDLDPNLDFGQISDLGLPLNWTADVFNHTDDPSTASPVFTFDSYAIMHGDGTYSVPEPTTMIAGALLLLLFGASTLRLPRGNRAA